MVCELRRAHPKWGALRILHELMRGAGAAGAVAVALDGQPHPHPPRARDRARATAQALGLRALAAAGGDAALAAGHRVRPAADRPGHGEVREGRIVTGVDDHSRFCVHGPGGRARDGPRDLSGVREALERYGAPEEVLTDNGKQFTDRFGRGGEVLFDKICRRNGIAHRLTAPRSPTTTGKIERFHQTLQGELLDDAPPFASLLEAQAALDDWVREYNADRPHQALETARRSRRPSASSPPASEQRELLGLWLPGSLATVPEPQATPTAERAVDAGANGPMIEGGPVEFDRDVPASGNLWAMGRQFWLGSPRAGQTVRFWAGVDVIHLTIAGARVKSLRSHLSTADLARLAHEARPRPARRRSRRPKTGRRSRSIAPSTAAGSSLAGRQVLAAEILGGRPVIVRIEPATLMFLDPDTRELLRVRPNPLTPEQALHLQGARPAGPPPRPRTEPVTVQRRVSATGVIVVCRQRVSLGRIHAGRVLTVHVSEHTLAVELDDETRTVRRTTSRPVVVIKGSRPHRARATSTELSSSAGRETEHPNRSRPNEPHDPYETWPRSSVSRGKSVKHQLGLDSCPCVRHVLSRTA